MSSGTAKSRDWVLEFTATAPRRKDKDTGWVSSDETCTQVRLRFVSLGEAQAYAVANGIAVHVARPPQRARLLKAYADNFSHERPEPWTH